MTGRAALRRLLDLPALDLEGFLGSSSPRVYLKLDAYNGFALGGNKVRKLEFELGPDRLRGITHLITCGGTHSNPARVTAAAAARLGLECTLVLNGTPPDPPTGNALLHRLFGARIRSVPCREDRDAAMEEEARRVEAEGGRPLVVPLGASTPRGALGYAVAWVELEKQLEAVGERGGPLRLVVPSSSCGTLAGLALGVALAGRDDCRLLGVSADVSEAEILTSTRELAAGAGRLLGWSEDDPARFVEATAAQVGRGYGLPTPDSQEAAKIFARTEGVVLDPTYTAKAGAALLQEIREGRLGPDERAVFIHTGGAPTTLAGGPD